MSDASVRVTLRPSVEIIRVTPESQMILVSREQGPAGTPGAAGPQGPAGPVGTEPDLPDLSLLFENQLV